MVGFWYLMELIMENDNKNDNAVLWASLDGSVIIDGDAIYIYAKADADDRFAFDSQVAD
jgi:hypothetical protein